MKLGMKVGLGPGNILLHGDAPPFPIGAQPPILAYVYCSQVAGWIQMPLGMEVGLGPGDFVLDGDPVFTPQKGDRAFTPNFRPTFIVAKWLDASRCHMVWR